MAPHPRATTNTICSNALKSYSRRIVSISSSLPIGLSHGWGPRLWRRPRGIAFLRAQRRHGCPIAVAALSLRHGSSSN
eukprot:12718350-Heterocapsa_arctica.AAC.1